MDGLTVITPNPVTWCSMKLAAMRDQRVKSEDTRLSPEGQKENRKKAVKHAMDVCRVVAMTTRAERDASTPDE